MKKLFNLLIITLLSVSAFGQKLKPEIGYGGVADYFSQKPRHEQMINAFKNPFDAETYWFVANNDTFMVSYEPYPYDNLNSAVWGIGEKRERKLWLYRLDKDGCKIATDIPLRIDYKWNKDEGKILCNYYYPRLDENGNGKIVLQNDGTVVIYLSFMYNPESNRDKTVFDTESIILTPNNNRTYHVSATGSRSIY